MPDKERLEELIALYSLGIIEEDELGELESFRENGSGEIRKRISEYERVANSLLYAADEKAPRPELREKLIANISASEKKTPAEQDKPSVWERLQPFWYGLGAAAAATAVFLFIANQSMNTQIDLLRKQLAAVEEKSENQAEMIESLQSNLETKNELIAKLENTVSRKAELVGYIENPDVIVIDLGNLKKEINSLGRVMWDKSRDSAIFCGINLPKTSPDKTYQLWAIIDSKPKSYGVFNVDEEGNGVIKLNYQDPYETIQQFAVTLEPAGGVPQPTGEMYLAGEASRL